jgi:hypothetical protein
MFKRSVLFSVLSVGVFASVWTGCSSTSNPSSQTTHDSGTTKSDSSTGSQDSGTTPGDTGTATDSTAADSGVTNQDTGTGTGDSGTAEDSGAHDGSVDSTTGDAGDSSTAMDAPGVDSAMPVIPPTQTPIIAGGNLEIWGVTGDDFIIYSDETSGTLYSIPVAGGTPKTITASLGAGLPTDGGTATHTVAVVNNVVFIWTALDAVGVGTMQLWTSAAASPDMVSTKALSGFGLATADSSHVAYFDNVDETNITGDFFEATAAGATKTSLVAKVSLLQSGTQNGGCTVVPAVAGSTYFVMNHCEFLADGGTPPSILSVFKVATGARTDLATTTTTDPSNFVLDPAGTQVLVSWDPGLEVFQLATSAGKIVDANGTQGGVITPDGLSAIYMDGTPALTRSLLATPAPTELQTAFLGFYGVTPNGANVIGFENFDMTGQTNDTDLWVASSTTTAAPKTITAATSATSVGAASPVPTAGGFSSFFTTDSSHVLYEDQSGANPTLNAFAMTGTTPTVIAQNPVAVFATGTSSSVIVFSDNLFPGVLSNGDGTTDIFSVDTGMTAAPAMVVSQANADFALTPAKDKVVFVWNVEAGPKSGLYVVAVP